MPRQRTLAALKAAFEEADHSNRIVAKYQVADTDSPVTCSLRFGPVGVAAVTDAKLDRTSIVDQKDGDVEQVLGAGKDIAGATLSTFSAVTATAESGAPIALQVTFTITGGIADYRNSMSLTANNVGDAIRFMTTVIFYT